MPRLASSGGQSRGSLRSIPAKCPSKPGASRVHSGDLTRSPLRTALQSTWNLYVQWFHMAAVNDITADNVLLAESPATAHGPKEALPKLMLGAIGVVYGDIGTSPLYTMKESFLGPHPLAVDRLHILGVLSLIFWSLMFVVTIKYVFVAMRADNKGEGGSFALLSLIARNLGHKKWAPALVLLGVLATCLFYGDAMI